MSAAVVPPPIQVLSGRHDPEVRRLFLAFDVARPDDDPLPAVQETERRLWPSDERWPSGSGAVWEVFVVTDGAGNRARDGEAAGGVETGSQEGLDAPQVPAADRQGSTLARAAAIVSPEFCDADGRPIGQLGWVAAVDDSAAVVAIVDAATKWIQQQRDVRMLVAPMNFDAWHPYRFKMSGFGEAPFAGEPNQPPYLPNHFAACGFRAVSEHVTKTINDPHTVAQGWERHHARALRGGFTFRTLDSTRLGEELALVHALSLAAFANLRNFTPLPFAEFYALYASAGATLDPLGIVVAVSPGGEPVGFAYSFAGGEASGAAGSADVFLKTFGVLPRWHGTSVPPALAFEVYRRWLARGMRRIHHCLMASGDASDRFDRGQARITRRYALLAKELPDASRST